MSKRLVPLAGLVCLGVVLAGSLTPGRTLAVPGGSSTFLYTGSEQTYPVASNLTGLHVVLVGAAGAEDTATNLGGYGGQVTVDLPLPAGTSTLYVEVGGVGAVNTGGWNGGGGGPFGGGGASDVRTVSCGTTCATGGDAASLDSRLVVANGGGGASDDQAGGSADSTDLSCTLCGAFGTGLAGGAAVPQATVTGLCQGLGDMNGEPGSDGSLGLGGAAATFLLTGPVDGGGGGGWYGGGGGGQCYDTGAVATVNAGSGGAGSSAAQGSLHFVFSPYDISDPSEVIITAPVPTATSTPTVAGELTVGDVLSESHAQWSSGMPLTGYTYQWERCNASGADCTAITGATGQTYALVKADLGDTIRVEESGENFYGSSASPATSAATSVVGEVPMATARPAVVGKPVRGETLLESHATWTDGPITGYGYQWERCSGGRCASIPGAVHDTYRPTKSDVGSTIKVQETATNTYGTSAPSTSEATPKVQSATAKAAHFTLLGAPTASASGVVFSVRCTATAGRACQGSAQLTTQEHRLRDKIVALIAIAKHHSKRVLVGSKNFDLAAGARETIHVPLNGRGIELLARFHRIPATLTITLFNTTPHTKIAARTTIKPR